MASLKVTDGNQEKEMDVLSLKQNNPGMNINICWPDKLPFIPWVGALLDSQKFVNQKEDSEFIN